jgi:hypothetical protein
MVAVRERQTLLTSPDQFEGETWDNLSSPPFAEAILSTYDSALGYAD